MERGLYIAAAGMAAGLARQDLLANDLANASTPGYKPDRASQQSFGSLLLANTRTGATVGSLGVGTEIASVRLDTSQAAIRETGEALDFAIEGDGFFAVQTPDGVRYTRNGRFTASAQGTLVDAFGHQVLDRRGAPLPLRGGTVDPARLGVVSLTNPAKVGESLLTGTPAGPAAATVRGGALEGSAVDPARALIDMIGATRAFEACQKAITTIDETLGRAAGQVGGLGG
jgi:flagellar basal-body rod protein FlgF